MFYRLSVGWACWFGLPAELYGASPNLSSGFGNLPKEFLERYFPMVIERSNYEPDSGGAGLWCGG